MFGSWPREGQCALTQWAREEGNTRAVWYLALDPGSMRNSETQGTPSASVDEGRLSGLWSSKHWEEA